MSEPYEFETVLVEIDGGVATVTMNRPEVHNAFNSTMQQELHAIWRRFRRDDDVRCVVLTGAGEKAFCTGIDRTEQMGGEAAENGHVIGFGSTKWHFDDPGDWIGPKTSDLWKPVIAAVNGMACGGAFYMLGEVDFIIAADHATFFDPHVTYGMCATFEPIHMLQKMPPGEVLRMTLLGAHERMSAARAHQIGFVSEVVPSAELAERAAWAAGVVASAPAQAVEGSVRSIWAGIDNARRDALALAPTLVALGTDPEAIAEAQQSFAAGQRVDWRVR